MEPKSLAWGTSISKSTFIAKTSAESSQTQHSVFSIPTVLSAIEKKFLSIAFIKQLTNFPEKMKIVWFFLYFLLKYMYYYYTKSSKSITQFYLPSIMEKKPDIKF